MSNPIEVEVLDPTSRPFIPPPPSDKKGIERYRLPGCGLILSLIALAWAIEIIDHIPGVNFDAMGLRPKELTGLFGIFTMPWIHGGIPHLFSNTIAFFFLAYVVLATEGQRFFRTSFWIIVLSGIGTWLIGSKGSVHIGASGLVYGYFGYLLMRSWLEKKLIWAILGVTLCIFYGGMIWGMMPTGKPISWEGHLCGFIAGVWMARQNKQARLM